MPRREVPLDEDAGEFVGFAAGLRGLRVAAGSPTYRELAKRAHYSAAALSEAANGRRLPSLGVTLAYVRACGGDVAEWEARWRALAVAPPTTPEGDLPAPYVGLRAFQPEDADRFFGRERLVGTVVELVGERRFTGVFGPSGSGKSSVLRAGLVAGWRGPAVVFAPGGSPVRELAIHVGAWCGRPASSLAAEFAAWRENLHLRVRQALVGRAGDLLLVVDQFEELFALCRDPDERVAFVAALTTAAAAPDSRTRVVLGVRADFLGDCARYPDLVEALHGGQVLVGPMSPDELHRAVVHPAVAVGAKVQTALVTRLVAEAAGQPAALPLLSHALLETWKRRRGVALTVDGYEETGGMAHAIARSAEHAYQELPEADREVARWLFLRLVAVGEGDEDTKRRVARAELDALGDGVGPVLGALASARLVVVGDDTVDLAHEALLRAWPRLRGWLAEDRDGLRLQRRLTEAADIWAELDHDPAVLYRTTRLARTAAWVRRTGPALTDRERDFLERSRAAEARTRRASLRRRYGVTAAVVTALVAATAVTVPMVLERREAERAALSRQLAAQVGPNAVEAGRHALEAWRTYPTAEARSSLFNAAATRQGEQHRIRMGTLSSFSPMALRPDGELVARVDHDRIALVSTSTLDLVAELPLHDPSRTQYELAFSPDGRLLAAGDSEGRVTLWAVPGGEQVGVIETGAPVEGLVFSADGSTLVARDALWDVRTRAAAGRLIRPEGAHHVVAAHDRTVATVALDGVVELWDLPSRSRVAVLRTGSKGTSGVAFAPDGRSLAVADKNGSITLWDPATATRITTTAPYGGGANGVAFSADGTVLASPGYDGKVVLRDAANPSATTVVTVEESRTPGVPTYLVQLAFGSNGTAVVAGGRDIHVWNADLPLVRAPVQAMQFAPDGAGLSTLDEKGVLTIWGTEPALRPGTRLDLADAAWATGAFSADRTKLAVLRPGAPIDWWSLGGHPTRTTAQGWRAPAEQPRVTAFGPDLRSLVEVGPVASDVVRHSGADGLRTSGEVLASGDNITGAVVLPGGRHMALGQTRGQVMVRDVATTRAVATFRGHDGAVTAMAVTADGHLLATAGADGAVVLWDTATWRQVARMTGHSAGVSFAAFSPDGHLLATSAADGTTLLWDVAAHGEWARLTDPGGQAVRPAWHPDGTALATADARGAITLWQLDERRAVAEVCADLARSGAPGVEPC
ncbi:nSTAND1 domain-containing NTPase [Saccharothrix syringae]|uniref:HTH cro/C1-type domain-containing protein n=1 Tax=Saccharothrix syringae TaxID=103733 RepID=A0A5Q0GY54_SACSY|nr:hypothetical protein [Saccharothrix syringae]QFZ18889.1 hypothetical protein EKG83_16810 [Saccharothrix syringae]